MRQLSNHNVVIPKSSSHHIVCYAHFSVVICTVIPGPYKTDIKNTANRGAFISVWAATSRREVKSSSLLGDSDAICMTVKNLLINLWFGFCNQNLSQVAVTVPHALMLGNISQEDPDWATLTILPIGICIYQLPLDVKQAILNQSSRMYQY